LTNRLIITAIWKEDTEGQNSLIVQLRKEYETLKREADGKHAMINDSIWRRSFWNWAWNYRQTRPHQHWNLRACHFVHWTQLQGR